MPDFWGASRRHLGDANFLYNSGRLDNADHLFGLAAECAVKYALLCSGVKADPPRGIEQRFANHIDKLRNEASQYLQSRKALNLAALLLDPGYFANWKVHDRYEADNFVDRNRCTLHACHARATVNLVATSFGASP
jgi:hypothetical protein